MNLQLTSSQVDTLCTLQAAYPQLTAVLIGAAALSAHIPLGRPTDDIDLVIVAPMAPLASMLEALGWERHRDALHRWRCVGGATADILTATEDVVRERLIRFEDGSQMNALGFDLVLRHAERVPLGSDGVTVAIASLATITILKMVAWLERPYERLKDLEDLTRIMEYALDDDDVRRWDQDHPVGGSDLDHESQSYFSVGVDVGRIAEPLHRAVVAQFLDAVRDNESMPFGRMLRAARSLPDETGAQRLRRLLTAFEVGLDAGPRGAKYGPPR